MENFKPEDLASAVEAVGGKTRAVNERQAKKARQAVADAAFDAELASDGERPRAVAKVNVVAEEDARLIKAVTDIVVRGAIDATAINDDGTPVDGELDWEPRRMRIAQDQRAPSKSAPGYLGVMLRVFESSKKFEAARMAPPPLNGDIKVFVNGDLTFKYPTKIVEDAED